MPSRKISRQALGSLLIAANRTHREPCAHHQTVRSVVSLVDVHLHQPMLTGPYLARCSWMQIISACSSRQLWHPLGGMAPWQLFIRPRVMAFCSVRFFIARLSSPYDYFQHLQCRRQCQPINHCQRVFVSPAYHILLYNSVVLNTESTLEVKPSRGVSEYVAGSSIEP